MSRKNDILLLFPPLVRPNLVYPALPYLQGFLKENGFKSEILDLNALFFDKVLSRTYLEEISEQIEEKFLKLEEKRSLSLSEQEEYLRLLSGVAGASYVLENIKNATQILRNSKDYVPWAKKVLELAFKLIGLKFFPFYFDTDESFETFSYEIGDHIKEAFLNKNRLPYTLFLEQNAEEILKNSPKFIGISVTFPQQIVPAIILATALKKGGYSGKIVLGGARITVLRNKIVNFLTKHFASAFDFFVIGEGEDPVVEILKNRNAKKIFNSPLKMRFPVPDFSGIPFELYFDGIKNPAISLLTSKGCYWRKCSFCDSFLNWGKKFRMISEKRLEETLTRLMQVHNFSFVRFNDEELSKASLAKIVSVMQKHKLSFEWEGNLRADVEFDDEFVKSLKNSGLKRVMIGFESGSPRILKLMNKGVTIPKLLSVMEKLKKFNIEVHLYFIVGFPGETEQDIAMTMNFLEKTKDLWQSAKAHLFELYERTTIFENSNSFSIKPSKVMGDISNRWEFSSEKGIKKQKLLKIFTNIENQIINWSMEKWESVFKEPHKSQTQGAKGWVVTKKLNYDPLLILQNLKNRKGAQPRLKSAKKFVFNLLNHVILRHDEFEKILKNKENTPHHEELSLKWWFD